MNEKIQKRIKQINIENNIWIIYLFIIILSYYANYKEKDFFLNNNQESKEIYRKINAFIFSILIIVYSYFEIDAITSLKESPKNTQNNNYDILSFIATTAVLISGIIFLYIIINDKDLEEEIAFN
jgi:amino acid transporter